MISVEETDLHNHI